MVNFDNLGAATSEVAKGLKKAGADALKGIKELKEVPTTGAVAKELENARLPEGSLVRTEAQDGFSKTISNINLGKVREQTIRGDRDGEIIRLTYSTEGDKKLISSNRINTITKEEEQIYPPPAVIGDEPISGVVAQDINTSILPEHNIIDRPDLSNT